MSLINKMLNDLEKRDAFLNESQDIVIDGLYSAYDIELNKKQRQSSSLLLFIFIVTLTIAIIFYFVTYETNVVKSEVVEYIDVDKELNAIQKEEQTVISNKSENIESTSRFLKLDSNLLINFSKPDL